MHETIEMDELSVVRSKVAVSIDDLIFPAGSLGTIVHVFTGKNAYIVEFSEPEYETVMLRGDDLELYDHAAA